MRLRVHMNQAGLFAVLTLGLGLRLWGIQDRLPDPTLGIDIYDDSAVEETDRTTMSRAWAMWGGGARRLDLNPHTAGWPALSFYVTLGFQALHRLQFSILTGSWTSVPFVQYVQANPAEFFLWLRIYSVIIGVLSIYLAYRLAASVLGAQWGLPTGLLLSLNPVHASSSRHIADPNMLALVFVLLATSAMVSVWKQRHWKHSIRAGASIGLAGACKYVPLALVPILVLAHLRASRDEPNFGRQAPPQLLLLSLVAVAGAFLLASPYLVLDWRQTTSDVGGQTFNLMSDWAGQKAGFFALPRYLTEVLPAALGWPAYLAAILGTLGLLRGGQERRIVGLVPVALVLAVGFMRTAQERYVLPMIPFLLLGVTQCVSGLSGRAAPRGSARVVAYGLAAATAVAAALAPLPRFAAEWHVAKVPDSRHLARRWLNAAVSPDSPVAADLYGPVFNSGREERLGLVWPFFAPAPERVRLAYHPEWLDGLHYYAMSSGVVERFEADPHRYSDECSFYSWIRLHGRLVWDSRDVPCAGPRVRIFALPDRIGTRPQRDSLWLTRDSKRIDSSRVSAWCGDLSMLHLRMGDYARSEEWARRGLDVAQAVQRPQLMGDLVYSLTYLGRPVAAEAEARAALRDFPGDPRLHLYRGLALENLGRLGEALAEYRTSLALGPNAEEAGEIRGVIIELEHRLGIRPSPGKMGSARGPSR